MSTEHTPGRRYASEVREPLDDDKWEVHWWNESMRLMLPPGRYVYSAVLYGNGTMQLTIKANAAIAKAEGGAA